MSTLHKTDPTAWEPNTTSTWQIFFLKITHAQERKKSKSHSRQTNLQHHTALGRKVCVCVNTHSSTRVSVFVKAEIDCHSL